MRMLRAAGLSVLLCLCVAFSHQAAWPQAKTIRIVISVPPGGTIDFLVRVAAGIIRKSPKHVTIIAPVVAYVFTFLAGTGHIFYPLLPVIYEVAMKGRVRPERPISVATIASQQAITASPVSAATAAMIGFRVRVNASQPSPIFEPLAASQLDVPSPARSLK